MDEDADDIRVEAARVITESRGIDSSTWARGDLLAWYWEDIRSKIPPIPRDEHGNLIIRVEVSR